MNSNQWIDVRERLPEKLTKVRWLCKDGVEDVGFYNGYFWTWDIRSEQEVTHWQPAFAEPLKPQQ